VFGKKKKQLVARVDSKIALCQEYTQLWQEFFDFFADRLHDKKITAEEEAMFFKCMTDLARKQYRLRYFLGDICPSDEAILKIVSGAVSLTTIYEMTEAQFSKLQHSWHVIFIALNKSLGRLLQQRGRILGAEAEIEPLATPKTPEPPTQARVPKKTVKKTVAKKVVRKTVAKSPVAPGAGTVPKATRGPASG